MCNVERNRSCRAPAGLTAIALWIGACSSGPNPGRGPDAGSDADAPLECSEQQRKYVDQVLAPDLQSDVAVTVQAVLGTDGFAQSMPFCSGPRPGAR